MRLRTLIAKLRTRLAAADTGHDFVDACCHRLGGQLRAGPPTDQHRNGG